MRLSILKHLRLFARPTIDPDVSRDADRLIRTWGIGAIHHAADFEWLADTGLVTSPKPGHWQRVRKEIGRRQDLQRMKVREPGVRFLS